MMSPISALAKSTPLRTRCTAPFLSGTRYRSCQSCSSLNGSTRRTYSSSSNASNGSETLFRSTRGFTLGVILTTLGFYVLQHNTVKLDGQNIGAVRPENVPKATTKQTRNAPPDPTKAPHYASPEEIQQAIKELKEALPSKDAVVTDTKVLESYGHSDNSYHPTSPHSVIVRPQSTEDVVKIVNIAREYRVPIVPYSGATSLEGQFSGVQCFFG